MRFWPLLAASAALVLACQAQAQQIIQVEKLGDDELTCQELYNEVKTLDGIIAGTPSPATAAANAQAQAEYTKRFETLVLLGMSEILHEYMHYFMIRLEEKKEGTKRVYGTFNELTTEIFIVLKQIEFILNNANEQELADLYTYVSTNNNFGHKRFGFTLRAVLRAKAKGASQDVLVDILARYLSPIGTVYKPQFNKKQLHQYAFLRILIVQKTGRILYKCLLKLFDYIY